VDKIEKANNNNINNNITQNNKIINNNKITENNYIDNDIIENVKVTSEEEKFAKFENIKHENEIDKIEKMFNFDLILKNKLKKLMLKFLMRIKRIFIQLIIIKN